MKLLIIILLLLSIICKGQDTINKTEQLLGSGTIFKDYSLVIGDTLYLYEVKIEPNKPAFRKTSKICIRKEK